MKTVYLVGSLRNPKVIEVANAIRKLGFDVFEEQESKSRTRS